MQIDWGEAPNVNDPGRVVAHRGASQVAPENTLAAFRKAAEQGARWVEFDVSLLGDATPVVHHDGTLERCTNGAGRLGEMTVADLGRIDAGGWKSSLYAGEPLPRLEAALETLAELALHANLEIKPHDVAPGLNAEVVAQTLKFARKPGGSFEETIVVSSFDLESLEAFRVLMPDQPIALLYNDPPVGWQEDARRLRAAAVHMNYRYLTDEIGGDVAREGMDLRVFTINRPEVVAPFRDLGLTGVITDHPPIFLEDPDWRDWAGRARS